MQDPIQNPDEVTCPYTGHKKLCKEKRAHCPKWIKLAFTHPQTGEKIDEWQCADTWLPILMIEMSQRIDGVQSATESFRNEMVRQNDELLRLNGGNRVRLIDGSHNDNP